MYWDAVSWVYDAFNSGEESGPVADEIAIPRMRGRARCKQVLVEMYVN